MYSIDLPSYDAYFYPKIGKLCDIHVPDGFTTGWLIPPWLKHRHTLILGDAKEELPRLLSSLGTIDVFLHDSLHVYEHVMFELTIAWQHLSEGGLLLCDDVNEYWTLAFIDFCRMNNVPHCVLDNRLGIAKKLESRAFPAQGN